MLNVYGAIEGGRWPHVALVECAGDGRACIWRFSTFSSGPANEVDFEFPNAGEPGPRRGYLVFAKQKLAADTLASPGRWIDAGNQQDPQVRAVGFTWRRDH
jgi:hypothetical protein